MAFSSGRQLRPMRSEPAASPGKPHSALLPKPNAR
jgi:hypothetical protein